MKKRLLTLILGLCLAMSVCACSNESADTDSKKETKEDNKKSDKDSKKDKEEKNKDDDNKATVTRVDEKDRYIYEESVGIIFVLNEDGSIKNQIDLNKFIEENIPEGYVTVKWATPDCQVFYQSTDSSDTTLYVNDKDGFRVVAENMEYPLVYVEDGMIFTSVKDYVNGDGNTSCLTYFPKEDGSYFAMDEFEDLSILLSSNGYYTSHRYYGDAADYSIPYCAKKYGIIPLQSTDSIYFYDEYSRYLDKITNPDGNRMDFMGYDGRYVAVEEQNDNYSCETIYVYDFETGDMKEVVSEPGATYKHHVSVLDIKDGFLYYTKTDFYKDDNSQDESEIHSYNIATGEDLLIKKLVASLAHDCLSNPGLYGFKVLGNQVYFLDETDDSTKWFTSSYENSKWTEAVETDMVAKEYSFAKLGVIKENNYSMKCPYCDSKAFKYHHEYMEFNSEVKNYEKINKYISDKAAEDLEYAHAFEANYTEEDCSEYLHNKENGSDYYEEDYSTVKEARRVLDHYISVQNYTYYWYIGAAHGFSGYVNFLFDENTGEAVTFADIYEGSEEKLKELVAEGACKIFDEGRVYFFAETRDELYDQVYGETSVDFPTISFYDDHLTFDFMQYDLVPYSEGIISIPVSYDDLGLNYTSTIAKSNETYDMDFVDVFGEHYTASINKALPMHTYSDDDFKKTDGKYYYEDDTYTSKLGIDVSKYQGKVDFNAVKDEGYEFAFLRLGYRGYGKDGTLALDTMFETNFVAAIDAGLDVGVYFFSQAVTEEEAEEEARFVLDELSTVESEYGKKYTISLPIVYDPESILDREARTDNVSSKQFTLNTHKFIDTIEDNGKDAMLYCNMLWQVFNLDTDDIFDGSIKIWYADYEPYPQTPYMFEIWQYSNEAVVPGISGSADVDIWILKKK